MARIELKNAPLYIKDGLSGTALVNDAAGWLAAATDGNLDTVALNTTVTDQVPVGARFTVAGEAGSPVHTVIDTDPNSGTTTNVAFTPAIAAGGVADNAAITFLPQLLYVKIGEGNVTFTEAKERIYDRDRGLLDTVRDGDEQPLELNLEFTYVYVTSETNQVPTPVDALKQKGLAASWVSSSSDQCEPYAVDIELRHCVPCGTDQDETLVFQDFRWESLEYDLQEATIAVSGRCNVTDAQPTRSTGLDCPTSNPAFDIT